MKIIKISHSCVLVEEQGVRILIDPGSFSREAVNQSQIDFVVITHQHSDHFDLEILQGILKYNSGIKVIANADVSKFLSDAGIIYELVDDGQVFDCNGVSLEAVGKTHAPIYPGIPEVENTGYIIGGKFYHPGDAYYVIDREIEILALPLGSPWGKISESLDFAKAINPKICFPIHDGLLNELGPYQKVSEKILIPEGIEFKALRPGGIIAC